MTTNQPDRLDRIEQILEAVAQRTDTIAQQQEISTRTIELLGSRVDSNARAIQANSESITVVVEAAGRTLRAVDELREIVEEDRINFREHLERTDTAIAGINATLAVLQQLMRDRNGNGDQPQP